MLVMESDAHVIETLRTWSCMRTDKQESKQQLVVRGPNNGTTSHKGQRQHAMLRPEQMWARPRMGPGVKTHSHGQRGPEDSIGKGDAAETLRRTKRHAPGVLHYLCRMAAVVLVAVATAVGGSPASAQGDFEARWKALQEAAKKEGELVILFGGAPGRMYRNVMNKFGAKFGIKVIMPPGSGNRLGDRLLAERQAGRYTADIIHMGANTVTGRLLPAGVLDDLRPELIHPEVTDPALWYKGKHWWLDAENKRYLIHAARLQASPVDARINTNLVTAKDMDEIKSVWDFLKPKWKGKIVAVPPTLEGAGQTWAAQYHNPDLGKDWLRRFITEMDVHFVTDFRQIADGLATGRYAMAFNIGAAGRDIDVLGEKGLPVRQFHKPLKEHGLLTTSGAGMIGVATNRPNPNASRLFVNWWLSKEGQTARQTMSDQITDQSMRTDGIPDGMTNETERRAPGVDYFFPMADPKIMAEYESARLWASEVYRKSR